MMTVTDLRQQITDLMGVPVRRLSVLHGGSVAEVYQAVLTDGQQLAIKVEHGEQAALHVEGNMLRYLAANSALPVPAVLYSSAELLVMQHLQGASHFSADAERDAAEHLAALHAITAPQFGFKSTTRIGGLAQPNPLSNSWINFFAEQRLLHRAHAARDARQLPTALLHRLERFAADLPRWLDEPPHPALIHGDVWTTNVLAEGGQIIGFIDPAIYYADPEIELAFITLFNTFGDPFFRRYHELRPIQNGFFEERRDIYNLYPLLVHVHLFGGSYVARVAQTLQRFGY